jgi:hypothetical protein
MTSRVGWEEPSLVAVDLHDVAADPLGQGLLGEAAGFPQGGEPRGEVVGPCLAWLRLGILAT